MNLARIDLAVLVISALSLWLWSRIKHRRRNVLGLPFPPGPKGLPIIGNVFDMPQGPRKEWLVVTDIGKKYGS